MLINKNYVAELNKSASCVVMLEIVLLPLITHVLYRFIQCQYFLLVRKSCNKKLYQLIGSINLLFSSHIRLCRRNSNRNNVVTLAKK